MRTEEFKNYISVDANVITSEVHTTDDIVAEIQDQDDEKINESDNVKEKCEEFQAKPSLTY